MSGKMPEKAAFLPKTAKIFSSPLRFKPELF
jgi:hypothetical protein